MHAVIRTGGKQYYVTAGDILEVEKLAGDVGETVALADVLMLAGNGEVTVGQPVVDGASVMAKITGQHRGQKIRVFRYRPKKRIRVRKGHRQYLTRIQIQSILLADGTEYQLSAPAATMIDEPVAAVEESVAAPVDNTGDNTGNNTAAEDTDNDSTVTAATVASEATAESENKE